jgi:hypothetical protein
MRAERGLLEGTVQAALVCDISFLIPCRVHQLLIGPLYGIDHWYGILAAEILSHLCIAATHGFTSTSYVERPFKGPTTPKSAPAILVRPPSELRVTLHQSPIVGRPLPLASRVGMSNSVNPGTPEAL